MFPDIDEELLKADSKEVLMSKIKDKINDLFVLGHVFDLATVVYSLDMIIKQMEERKKVSGL